MRKRVIEYLTWLIFVILLFGSAVFRIKSYGDPLISIGTVDTPVFISSAKADLDFHFLETGRPPTLPLLYKIMQPPSGFNLTAISQPSAADGLRDLQWQPGFDQVVWMQMLVSIIAWSVLSVVVFYRLRSVIVKLLAALAILAFAYSPQLAEWDRILLSESISFSLFALLIALTIELAFRIMASKTLAKGWLYLCGALWFIVFFLWVFTRDANTYLIPVTIFIGIVMIILPSIRRHINIYLMIGLGLLLSATFYLQQVTMRASQRWILPFLTNVSVNVLPYPDRVEFFETMGMPVSNELMELQSSMGGEEGFYKLDEFMDWAVKDGTGAYTKFLLEYPLWASIKLYDDLELLFSENLQPWFTGPPDSHPLWMIKIGDMLHPKSSAALLLDALLTIMILLVAIQSRDVDLQTWACIAVWLLMGEMVLIFISYHGDARSTIRHTLVAVMPLRMSIWLLTMLVFDLSYASMKPKSQLSRVR